MGSTCIDSILHDLKLLEIILDKEDNGLEMLKLDLRFLRTFLLCSRQSFKGLFLESDQNKHVRIESCRFRIENDVHKMKQRSEDAVHKMEQRSDDGFKSSDLKKVVSDFREIISSFKQEIKESYMILAESSWLSISPMRDELLEIIDSLLENLFDLKWGRPYDQAFFMVRDHDKIMGEFVEALEGKLTFFRSFIRNVTWQGVEHRQLDDLLTHFEVMAVNGAMATYMCWFDRFDKLILILVQLQEIRPDDPRVKDDSKLIPELLEKIKPDNLKVLEIYVQVLTATKSSGSSRTLPLETGLRFLLDILKNQQDKCNGLDRNVKDLIEVVVNDAGIVICSLFLNKMKEIPDEEIDTALCNLLDKIKLIKAEIELVETEALEIDHNKYRIEVEKAAKTVSEVLPKRSIPTINEVEVGLHDELETIVDQLTRGSAELDMITIVGMPGLGKTTLAKRVYNDPLIVCHFYVRAWCCISQVYSKKDLLIEILDCIVPAFSDHYSAMDEDNLALELYKRLKKQRYLIILDDIWDIEAWNELKASFSNDANGSRILLTSRLREVALQIKPNGQPHLLRHLSDGESWKLLQKKLLSKQAYPHELSDLGMQIAKNCKGLPLSIVIVAGILATVEQDDWEKIAEMLRSNLVSGTEHVMNILELSYRHLPDHLKICFLYFGAFPEDREIPIWKLTCLWIAEGFVQKDESRSLEDLAEDCMMSLIDRSLVMVAKQRSIAGVKTCRIHDLLHEFCMTKAKEGNFMHFLRGSNELSTFNESGNIGRLCIHSKVKDFQMSRLFCPQIHCLLFFAQGYVPQMCNISFIFCICKLLRVLDLEQIVIGNTFPSEIELLVELRYLAIHGDIESIPLSIANLSNLETLRVKVFYLEALMPATIWNMRKLRHLVGLGKFVDSSLMEDNLEICPSLDDLDTLSTLTLSIGPTMGKIMRKFPNIRKLKCRMLESGNSVDDSERIVAMDFLHQLESLKLFLGLYHVEFRFPSKLKKLTLDYFSWSIVSAIGKLPNLEVLKLHNAFGEVMWDMEEGEFPNLRILKLGYLNMVRWTGSEDDLPCLEKLVLEKFWKLAELPPCLGSSYTLEMIEVRSCPKSVTSLVREIEDEQRSTGNEHLKINIL